MNRRNEVMNKCRHKAPLMLSNFLGMVLPEEEESSTQRSGNLWKKFLLFFRSKFSKSLKFLKRYFSSVYTFLKIDWNVMKLTVGRIKYWTHSSSCLNLYKAHILASKDKTKDIDTSAFYQQMTNIINKSEQNFEL